MKICAIYLSKFNFTEVLKTIKTIDIIEATDTRTKIPNIDFK